MHLSQEATRTCTQEGVSKPRKRKLSIQYTWVQHSKEAKGIFQMMVKESQAEGWSVGPKTKAHRVKQEGRGFQEQSPNNKSHQCIT